MTQLESTKIQKQKKPRAKSALPHSMRLALFAGFGLAALLVGYLTFVSVRDFIAHWQMTNLPGATVRDATPTPNEFGEIVAPGMLEPALGPTPPPWDGADRVTMLVMGLDYRDWEAGEGPPRTDTMILFTVDPVHRTAGILSIPRDLWVSIPGADYGRINTAYQIGEAYQLPGGGPALAAETVEGLLGVPVDYYAQIDFGAFVRFIDEIGGVKVEFKETIKLDPMGTGNTKRFKPGVYTLPGDLALAYVRLRKTEGGDFDRAQRQQAVIMSIRNQILSHKMLPTLIAKAPTLYNELSAGIHTNLTLDQAIRLAWLASQIPEENIKRGAIGTEHITFAKSPDGTQDVLKPITEKIRALRDEVFSEANPAKPVAASMDIAELIKQENARVRLLNGSSVPGLAARTQDYLKSLGINVIETGNAEQYSAVTQITFYTGKPYTLKYLVDLMKINSFRIRHLFDPTNGADIVIILGDDWAQNNPMP
ncbi:MAG: LCP family protein [Anaerolineales bacterium]|jgi:LCP family protein required for cell wall assembly|nr:LCP family protein [Anaerolineales bacterium]